MKRPASIIAALAAVGFASGAQAQGRPTPIHLAPKPVVEVAPTSGLMQWTNRQNVGEGQSTVVAPGLKKQCPMGRLVMTNDRWRPEVTANTQTIGPVAFRDLGVTGSNAPGSTQYSKIDGSTQVADLDFIGQDHNLAVMPNGDLIYSLAMMTKQNIFPGGVKPWWFDKTFRVDPSVPTPWGPGVRVGIVTFKSDDCGDTFHYASIIDPAAIFTPPATSNLPALKGDCAFPQALSDKAVKGDNYDMGGSDGPWVGVDRTGRILSIMGCYGRLKPVDLAVGIPKEAGVPRTDYLGDLVRKSVVHTSVDGVNWTYVGALPGATWEGAAVVKGDKIAILNWDTITVGTLTAKGGLVTTGSIKPTNLSYGYPGLGADTVWFRRSPKNGEASSPATDDPDPGCIAAYGPNAKDYGRILSTNRYGFGAIGRDPNGGRALVAMPETFGKVYGYRLYRLKDGIQNGNPSPVFEEFAKTLKPSSGSDGALVFHPTFIDSGGDGPVLLYWIDVNPNAKTADVRGKVFYANGVVSQTFVISRSGAVAASFAYRPGPCTYWYGDFNTAGGFRQPETVLMSATTAIEATAGKTFGALGASTAGTKAVGLEPQLRSSSGKQPDVYRFFPIWPVPTFGMAYAEVVVTVTEGSGGGGNGANWPLRGALDWRVPADVEPGDPVERGVIFSTKPPGPPEWMREMVEDNQRLNSSPQAITKGPVAVKVQTKMTEKVVSH